jgi:hypothetical protein
VKRILSRDEIRQQGEVVLNFSEPYTPDKAPEERPKRPSELELWRLERAFAAGGPIDDSATPGQPARAHFASPQTKKKSAINLEKPMNEHSNSLITELRIWFDHAGEAGVPPTKEDLKALDHLARDIRRFVLQERAALKDRRTTQSEENTHPVRPTSSGRTPGKGQIPPQEPL